MNDTEQPEEPLSGTPIAIHTEHGSLHGLIALPQDARSLVVLAYAGATSDARDSAVVGALRQSGMATLVIDLLTHQEEHFADVHNNIPLLVKRLLDCLALIKRQMQNDELPTLPIGLCGTGTTSPVAIRVAALRDHDISAIVCLGGLIDLAGILYLRTLESPLLVLVGEADSTLIASNRRALNEVACTKALELIPETATLADPTTALDAVSRKIAHWFGQHA